MAEVTPVLSVSCSGWMGSVAGVFPGASGWFVGLGLWVRVELLGVSSEVLVSVDIDSLVGVSSVAIWVSVVVGSVE